MVNKRSFFICNTCGLEQNLDQSVHIEQKYCVSCYNKEQIHRESKRKFDLYHTHLKETDSYTKIRSKKLSDLTLLNEILLPLTIFQLEEGEILDYLNDARKTAFRKGLVELAKKYNFEINPDLITIELIEKLKPIWGYSKKPARKKLETIFSELDPFISHPIQDLDKFYFDMKKEIYLLYFTLEKDKYVFKQISPYKFNDSYIIQVAKAYKKRIEKISTQTEKFKRFIRIIAHNCQFQTIDDGLKKGIQKYALDNSDEEIERLANTMMQEIESSEDSPLIPNIAKYIMDNHARIFELWFSRILPFERSRFMSSLAKTGSRTDFIIRLEYNFKKNELKMITDELRESTELLLREKAKAKIKKFNADENLTPEKKQLKIEKIYERLEKNLIPENLETLRQENSKGSAMVARYLLLNSEKGFNLILDKIIRHHYKRLQITTPVSYITNVLESGAVERRGELKAFYLIQSREW